MQQKVYIILVNYNGLSDTAECVSCLFKNTYLDTHVVVIDNASTKGDIMTIKEQYPTVEVIRNKANDGFAIANNLGIEFALEHNADYIMLLNNDTIVTDSFVEDMLNIAQQNSIDVLTCKMCYYAMPDKIWYGGGNVSKLKGYGEHIVADTYSAEINEIDFISGCCIMATRKVFEQHKLPTDYFMYFEDLDFCLTLKKAGIKMYYTPNVVLYHKISASAGVESPFFIYYWNRNRQILLKRHKEYFGNYYWRNYCYFVLTRIVKTFKYFLQGKNNECKSMWKGFFSGLSYKVDDKQKNEGKDDVQ